MLDFLRTLLYLVARFLLFWAAICGLRVRVWGRVHVPRRGACIIAANHQSFFDPPVVGCPVRRILSFLARDTLFANPLFGWLIRMVNAFPVKRGAGDVGAFKQSLRFLRDGKAMILFPEGRRSPDGRIGRLQPGVVALACKTGAVVIPTVIEGFFELWPRTARFPRLGPVWIQFGPPIPAAQLADLTTDQAAERLTHILRDMHNQLRVRAGRPPFDYPGEAGQVDVPVTPEAAGSPATDNAVAPVVAAQVGRQDFSV